MSLTHASAQTIVDKCVPQDVRVHTAYVSSRTDVPYDLVCPVTGEHLLSTQPEIVDVMQSVFRAHRRNILFQSVGSASAKWNPSLFVPLAKHSNNVLVPIDIAQLYG